MLTLLAGVNARRAIEHGTGHSCSICVMVSAILLVMLIYAAVGALFAVPFVWWGMERVDLAARSAPWTFRLLVLPGVAALWPLMTLKWYRAWSGGRNS